jgi:hypothetical protein
MLEGMKVFGRVLIFGRIATTYMATSQTHPQMHPAISHLQAFFTALRVRFDIANLIEVRAFVRHFPFPSDVPARSEQARLS